MAFGQRIGKPYEQNKKKNLNKRFSHVSGRHQKYCIFLRHSWINSRIKENKDKIREHTIQYMKMMMMMDDDGEE